MTAPKSETIEKLSHEESEYPPPKIVAENALLKDAKAEYERLRTNPDAFWAAEAKKFVWLKKWDKISTFDGVNHEWFVGGKTNITLNALDRHAESGKIAYIWLGENGEERKISYAELLALVCRFANGLKSLNVKKGDRVVIYMPLTIEGVVAMLVCARIGAIHSVVYAGLGQNALRERIVDADAKILIAGDVGFRRGKTIDLKSIADEAVKNLDVKVVVFRRISSASTDEIIKPPDENSIPQSSFDYLKDDSKNQPENIIKTIAADSASEIDFNDLLKFPDECPAESMDAEDTLYILYTSGTIGKPKGVVHAVGGYMVGTTYHLKNFFDFGGDDVFWCMSDIGWIVGHSYIVYAPLCARVTTVFREGAIDFPHQAITWEIVEKYKITKMFTAPTAIRFFMRFGEALPKKYNLTSLRVLACAGEPLNPEVIQRAERMFDARVYDNYWQTETGSFVIANRPNLTVRRGAMGKAVEGVQVSIIDNSGREVLNGVVGDIAIRPTLTSLFKGYWNFPEATRACFRADWYITRDRENAMRTAISGLWRETTM